MQCYNTFMCNRDTPPTCMCTCTCACYMQVCGTLLTVCGVVLVFLVSAEPSFPHAVIGILLTITVLQQFLSGVM